MTFADWISNWVMELFTSMRRLIIFGYKFKNKKQKHYCKFQENLKCQNDNKKKLVCIGIFLPCRQLHTDELRKIKKEIWIFLSKKRLKPAPFLGYEPLSLFKRHLSLFILYNRRPTDHWNVFPLGIIRGNKHHLVKKQQQQNFLFFDQNIKFDFYLWCQNQKPAYEGQNH
jgi:hypothetical protein